MSTQPDHLLTARPGDGGRWSRAGARPPPPGPPEAPAVVRAARARLAAARGAMARSLATVGRTTPEERREEVQALIGVFLAEGGRR